MQIRLGNSQKYSNKTGGRVEIYHPSFGWGTVSDSGWSEADSGVVCRQLGFTGGNKPTKKQVYASPQVT